MRAVRPALTGQFVGGEEPPAAPEDWRRTSVRRLHLATAPDLPMTPVAVANAGPCGYLLGTVVRDGRLLDETTLRLAAHPDGPVAAVEAELPALGGRHVAVVDAPGGVRVHPDAAATRSVVYDPQARLFGATPAALLSDDDYRGRLDRDLAAALDMPAADHWYPGELTPHEGLLRLLPNHVLDVTAGWKARRHRFAEPPAPAAPGDAADEIAALVTATLGAVAERHTPYLSLTAGRDSRLLLACARPIADEATFFTFAPPERSVDVAAARVLAERWSLSYRELRVSTATPEQADAWLLRVGHAVSGAIREIHPTLAGLRPPEGRDGAGPAGVLLTGMAGEVARGYYWERRDAPGGAIDAATLVARLHLPGDPRVVAAVDAWLAPLRGLPLPFVLDLAYLELRVGCWSGPQGYGSDPYADLVVPLAHARIFELMLGLPPEYRREERLAADVCARQWPELLDLPFNAYSGARGALDRAALPFRAAVARGRHVGGKAKRALALRSRR